MGFPTRTGRAAYGPDPINTRPVRDPRKHLDADIAKLMMWQLGGLAQVVPVAWALIDYGSGTIALAAHGEAWNPDGTLSGPTLVRTGTGVYTVTYASQYPDENGANRSVALEAAIPAVQGLTAGGGHQPRAWTTKLSAVSFQVDCAQADTGTHDDCDVLVLFW